jgi:hypothetical protein
MEVDDICIYVCVRLYAYRYEGARFGDILRVNYAFKYIIFGDFTAWDRSHGEDGCLEFAIVLPVEFGLTLKKKVHIARNVT